MTISTNSSTPPFVSCMKSLDRWKPTRSYTRMAPLLKLATAQAEDSRSETVSSEPQPGQQEIPSKPPAGEIRPQP
jgi:hypothetical protein